MVGPCPCWHLKSPACSACPRASFALSSTVAAGIGLANKCWLTSSSALSKPTSCSSQKTQEARLHPKLHSVPCHIKVTEAINELHQAQKLCPLLGEALVGTLGRCPSWWCPCCFDLVHPLTNVACDFLAGPSAVPRNCAPP